MYNNKISILQLNIIKKILRYINILYLYKKFKQVLAIQQALLLAWSIFYLFVIYT